MGQEVLYVGYQVPLKNSNLIESSVSPQGHEPWEAFDTICTHNVHGFHLFKLQFGSYKLVWRQAAGLSVDWSSSGGDEMLYAMLDGRLDEVAYSDIWKGCK